MLGRLIEADPVAVAEVLGDPHYGSAATRTGLADAGIDLVAPAPPASPPPGGLFSKDDFVIDLDAGTVSCPGGHLAVIPAIGSRGRAQVRFGADHCRVCPLRTRCTTSPKDRLIEVRAEEALLAAARAARWTPGFRDRYRERSRIERKAAQIKFRQPKVPLAGPRQGRCLAQAQDRCPQPRSDRPARAGPLIIRAGTPAARRKLPPPVGNTTRPVSSQRPARERRYRPPN